MSADYPRLVDDGTEVQIDVGAGDGVKLTVTTFWTPRITRALGSLTPQTSRDLADQLLRAADEADAIAALRSLRQPFDPSLV